MHDGARFDQHGANGDALMVSVDELDALDLLIWLGRGEGAAQRQRCKQSTISRRCQTVLRTFGLRLHKDGDGWPCTGRHALLQREREVHQLHRLGTGLPLRVDASLLAAPLLRPGVPQGWWQGTLDEVGWQRPLQLLRQRILDAWVTGMGHELPAAKSSWFQTIPLLRTPLQLAARSTDPLLLETGLQACDVAAIPRLAPRPGSYPQTEQLLGSWRHRQKPLLLGSQARRRAVLIGAQGDGPLRLLQYGTAVSLASQTDWRPLALNLGVTTECCLVIHRDLAEHPRLLELLALLRRRAAERTDQSSLVATP